jgi:ankyrin repeat protein
MAEVHNAIRAAIQARDEDKVQSLLSDQRREPRKVSLNTGDNLLHEAIRHDGSPELIRDLIAAGVPIDQCNNLGQSPLYLAAARGQKNTVLALLECNASPAISALDNQRPLDEAIHQGYVDIALALIEAGPVNNRSLIDAVRLYDPRPALALLARGVDPNIVEPFTEMRPIHYAAQGASQDITDALIEAGATLNNLDSNQRTPLHHAAFDGQEAIIEQLMDAGADPRIADQQGRTPLTIAVSRNQSKAVHALLQGELGRGTIDQPNKAGITPLQIARHAGRADLVQIMMSFEQDQEEDQEHGL